MDKTRRAFADPIERGVLVTRELGNGYRQTQAGPNAIRLEGKELERALAYEDERPAEDRIHRVELTPEELAELEQIDPELET